MKKIKAKYRGSCWVCGNRIEEGETIFWEKGKGIAHVDCVKAKISSPSRRSPYVLIAIILVLIVALGALLTVPKGPELVTVTATETITIVRTSVVTVPPSTPAAPTTVARKWISFDENVISYLDAAKYVGQVKTVEGTIVRTYKSSKAIFLNFHDPWQGYFYIVIFRDDWDNFPFDPAEYYKGKEVRVTGVIKMYKGSPEIIVEDPSQIEVAYKGFNYP